MQHRKAPRSGLRRRILPIAITMALAVAYTIVLAQVARAERVTPPPVPGDLEAPEGTEAYFVGHAVGTQNYICLPSGSGLAWTLFTPQATLFNDHGKPITTHFLSPNPYESGTLRPAWQHARDASTVWVRLVAPSSDTRYVAPGAIPWLLLEVEYDRD